MIFPYLKIFIKSIYYLGQPKPIRYDYRDDIFVYDYSSMFCLAYANSSFPQNTWLNIEPNYSNYKWAEENRIIRADENDIKGFLKELNI